MLIVIDDTTIYSDSVVKKVVFNSGANPVTITVTFTDNTTQTITNNAAAIWNRIMRQLDRETR